MSETKVPLFTLPYQEDMNSGVMIEVNNLDTREDDEGRLVLDIDYELLVQEGVLAPARENIEQFFSVWIEDAISTAVKEVVPDEDIEAHDVGC